MGGPDACILTQGVKNYASCILHTFTELYITAIFINCLCVLFLFCIFRYLL